MTNIFTEGDTCVGCEEDNLVVQCQGQTTSVPVSQLESVAELSPCSTFGKYLDIRVVALKSAQSGTILIPISKEGAHTLLKGIQQWRLRCAYNRQNS
ncbi:hypothetical protein [Alicyclobacillus ferrooxydans]|nr:hypothetical protein [Alicyclobacillus ferrooxydans]